MTVILVLTFLVKGQLGSYFYGTGCHFGYDYEASFWL